MGIIVSDDCIGKQCPAAVKQANKILRMIKRNFPRKQYYVLLRVLFEIIVPLKPVLSCVFDIAGFGEIGE